MFLLYMAMDPFNDGSISTIIDVDDGLAYYIIRPGCRLFKATKSSDTLDLRPGRLSFFGVHNMDSAYIDSYENEYGIIFAFETTRPYKLLALDHTTTKMALYNRVPENIQRILRRNYGYNTMSGARDSELDSDLALSQYLCNQGYQGYATKFMDTDTGEFHPEFMICNVDGIRLLSRVTNDPTKIANILRRGEIDQVSRDLKVSRTKNRPRIESPYVAREPRNLFASYDSPPRAPSRFAMESSSGIPKFSLGDMDDDDDDDDNNPNSPPRTNKRLFGGLRKGKSRSYKKRKTRTNKRKRNIRTKKGTSRRR
jgi:hypothetical protein